MPDWPRRQARANEDMTTTPDQTDWFDMGDESLQGVVASVYLAAIAGGSSPGVTVTLEHSPDKVIVHDVGSTPSALENDGEKWFESFEGPLFRYMRFSWVTTGSPSQCDVDLNLDA